MKVFPDKLAEQISHNGLAPVYVIAGDEPLLHMEACDHVRQTAREQGADEREILEVEAGFNWAQLGDTAQSLSLFSQKRLIELRLGSQSPGQEGAKAIETYCAQASQSDDILLVSAARLDYRTQQSKWFKALDKTGVFVPVWPIDFQRLHYWVRDRAAMHGFDSNSEACHALAERYEGNLLALDQTLIKLKLLHPASQRLTIDMIEGDGGDGARFDVFTLCDACIQGDRGRALRIIKGLAAEGIEAPVVLWALTRELRTLLSLRLRMDQGQSFEHACKGQKPMIIERRRAAYQNALKRLPRGRLQKLLTFAQRLDLSIKGNAALPLWDGLSDLALTLSGGRGPLCEWPAAYRSQVQ